MIPRKPLPATVDLATIDQRPRSERGRTRTGLYVLIVLTAGAYLPSPLYPSYQAGFGVSDLLITVLYATFALVSAPALVLFGSASDTLGPRGTLRVSLLLAALGSACFACANGPVWLLFGRAAQGLALGAATGAAGALISSGSRGRSAAVATSIAFVAGTAAGPIVGGVLAETAPAPLVLPFILHLVLLGFGWRRVSALSAFSRPARRWHITLPAIPRGTRLLFTSAAATGFLAWTVAGLFLAVIPTLLHRGSHTGPAVIGCVLGSVLLCSVFAQRFVARLGGRRAQLAGLLAALLSLGTLAVTAAESLWLTLLAAVVAGLGHGLAYGGAASAVDAIAPAGKRGGITGALYPAFYLGAACPAIAIGLLTIGMPLTTATTLVTAIAAGLVPLVGASVALLDRPRSTRVPGAIDGAYDSTSSRFSRSSLSAPSRGT